ncbi:type II toxin-antitoxin system VapC family toxin [Spirosoma taeanense]|uniref:type II toxin-antitoxin system VapC family toxin n=1 Tax=Spirosoma taeanense TaxID=2735870 RepID=UPI001F04F82B|nr:type II toxin-antitoxin system VapC family toxin [Spirosoma taeanense]
MIDTQVFVWSLVSPAKLSTSARHALQDGTIYVSVVSLLEIAIKQKVNKLPDLPITTDELVEQLKRDGFELLPLSTRHIARYNDIPLQADHRDPRSVVTRSIGCCWQRH